MIILDLYFKSFSRQSRLVMSGLFVENLQSVQKCIQIKENEKKYCDFNFYSILINFVSN